MNTAKQAAEIFRDHTQSSARNRSKSCAHAELDCSLYYGATMDPASHNDGVVAETRRYADITASGAVPTRWRRATGPSRLRSTSRWLPAAFLGTATLVVLHIYGVSGSDIAAFFAYITLGLALPGVLLIRLLYRGPRSLAEEFALGLALGYALQVPAYIAARAIGVPLLVLVFPLGTYLLFLAFPGLRSHWRGAPRRATPLWWSWSIALTILLLIAWSAATFFGKNALTWPALGASNVDASFHLALIGELKHHMPPEAPMVAGEPLLYHWFVHAHLAATSWVTGVEPVVLLLRLACCPCSPLSSFC